MISEAKSARRRVLDFFNSARVRIAISRETLSRVLSIAYPTLDIVLAGLVAEGRLEQTSMDEAMGMWRPARNFVFSAPASGSNPLVTARAHERAAKAERLAAAIKAREERAAEVHNRAIGEWRDRRAERAEKREAWAASKKAAKLERENARNTAKAAKRAAKLKAADERFAARCIVRAEAKAKRLERYRLIDKNLAEAAARKAAIADNMKAGQQKRYGIVPVAAAEPPNRRTAEPPRPTLRHDTIEIDGRKFAITISTPPPKAGKPPDPRPVAEDPWAKLKARANARPKLIPGGMMQDTARMMRAR